MDYKKIIKTRKTRKKILNLFSFIPDELMLRIQYFIKMDRILRLKRPTRFTEKIQWYKLKYKNEILADCVDKYEVRKYLSQKGLSEFLNEIYGIYRSFDEINFSKLPDRFVIKNTLGGGNNSVLICKDKKKLDIKKLCNQIKEWDIKINKSCGREWPYECNTARIIIEKYLVDEKSAFECITDYKFFCFNGIVKYIVVDINRSTNHRRNIYDINWNVVEVETDCPRIKSKIEKPTLFKEMVELAQYISQEFPFVRVDLYCINDEKIVFGELTFYPWSGYIKFKPDEFDFILGEKFIINN